MGSNTFGTIFRITTWGESHGKAIGVVIDGCPAGLEISDADINAELSLRRTGKNSYTTPRKEPDQAEIWSGVFEGKTTGTPISIVIYNRDVESKPYEPIKHLLRPGHANYTYLQKYGLFDYRGTGRASARETACRMAAAAVARKLVGHYGMQIAAYLQAIGDIQTEADTSDLPSLRQQVYQNPIHCPDPDTSARMMQAIDNARESGDSLGGVIAFIAQGLPAGLGDPIYEKLEANLAKAMLSLPATKGFEIGSGFRSSQMKGSQHNDPFISTHGQIKTQSNHAGGTLGGISTGMPLVGRVAFKPASGIKLPQDSVTQSGEQATFQMPENSRHDPCVAIRAVPIVEAMVALVLADALLLNRCSRL